jgi:hypothetical protein
MYSEDERDAAFRWIVERYRAQLGEPVDDLLADYMRGESDLMFELLIKGLLERKVSIDADGRSKLRGVAEALDLLDLPEGKELYG